MTDSNLHTPEEQEMTDRVSDKILIHLTHSGGPFVKDEDIEVINWLANLELWRRRSPSPLIERTRKE